MDLDREDAAAVVLHHDRVPFDPRPAGLLDVRWLEDEEGRVTTLSQWSAPVEPPGAVAYRRYRSAGLGAEREAGCVVLVEIAFDRPGVAEPWVDLVLEALAGDDPVPGGVSARFHVSLDGTRVLNYAEWVTAAHHRDAMARGDGSVGVGEPWRRVRSFTGLTGSEVRRHRVLSRRYSPHGKDL
ncbi:hypothetical protein [Saccharothrix sp. Mg75]|uniref:hypothetical protein n=1 Tax=Saccharothrix sp. Mg75 TaxID=3445357 RepID=UPI003EEC6CCA